MGYYISSIHEKYCLAAEIIIKKFMDDKSCRFDQLNVNTVHEYFISYMLDVANKFYVMNNTKINFSKADLITNCEPDAPDSR